MTSLVSRLRLPEAVGLSLSVVSPTVTAAFNITLIVQATGPAAPLAFAIGMVAMALVALSFMAFTHRVAHAGSAYAYIAHTFGSRAGFIAGWTLLLDVPGLRHRICRPGGQLYRSRTQGASASMSGSWWIGIGSPRILAGVVARLPRHAACGPVDAVAGGRCRSSPSSCCASSSCSRFIRRGSKHGASFRALAEFQWLVRIGFRHGVQHLELRAASRAPRRSARRPSIRGAISRSRSSARCCSRASSSCSSLTAR